MRSARRIVLLMIAALLVCSGKAFADKQSTKGQLWFYRIGRWIDNYELSGVDTNYITLPEYSWRVALNTGSVGINSSYLSTYRSGTTYMLQTRTAPSVELGLNAGYRGFGGGYSMDLVNAYATNWNISLGSKAFGLEFMRQLSTNIINDIYVNNQHEAHMAYDKGDLSIKNTYITAWYALNSRHYAHNAAIKQSHIQRRSAGSIILSAAYMSSTIYTADTVFEARTTVMDNITRMITQQFALGIGYGINYTPNQGKVLLHLAANMQVVCYSINTATYNLPDTLYQPGQPQFTLYPSRPVHVTGNVRAAVSWEIKPWVHLSAWAQGNHLLFDSKEEMTLFALRNWHWQAHLTVGFRFGAGKHKIQRTLEQAGLTPEEPHCYTPRTTKLPQWITDYFYTPGF